MAAQTGRPLEFDPDTALASAMDVFWKQGFENTSMQDLLVAMDLSKSSLYQTFGNKQALFERCLGRYGDTMVAALRAMLAESPSGMDFIRVFLESVLDEARGVCEARGCLLLNTASEFADRDPSVARVVSLGLDRFHALLRDAVVRAQGEGDIPAGHDPAVLASFLVNGMSGLKTLSKAGVDEARLRGIIDLTLRALQ